MDHRKSCILSYMIYPLYLKMISYAKYIFTQKKWEMVKLPNLIIKCVISLRRKSYYVSRHTAKVEAAMCLSQKKLSLLSYEKLSQKIFYLTFWKRNVWEILLSRYLPGTFTDKLLKHILYWPWYRLKSVIVTSIIFWTSEHRLQC